MTYVPRIWDINNERFENALKKMHHEHLRKNARLQRAEKRALKLIRMSRKGKSLNSTELMHVKRYMDRRKAIEEAEAKKNAGQ